jgi:hypothetical protein
MGSRGYGSYAVPRGYGNYGGYRGYQGSRGYGSYGGYAPYRGYAYGGYRGVGPVHYIRPYYAFRPRVSLGFGIWAGYPFAYSYGFYDPFVYADGYGYPGAYPYPYPSGYPAYDPSYPPQAYPPSSGQSYPPSTYPPSNQSTYPPAPQGSLGVQPGQENMGGLSFDITPSTAQVFIDGRAVGTVGQFTPSTEPLGLPAGRHHLEVRAPGYQTLTFDVDIVAGQVIPYQGSLER